MSGARDISFELCAYAIITYWYYYVDVRECSQITIHERSSNVYVEIKVKI